MTRRKRNNKGFNLVETITASIILSGAVLTIGAISTRSLVNARLNRQYEVAASLIDRQLTMIDYMGIDQFIELGQMEGVFEEYEPGYQWTVSTQYQDIDNLYLVRITVMWIERNRPYSISAETVLNSQSTLVVIPLEQ